MLDLKRLGLLSGEWVYPFAPGEPTNTASRNLFRRTVEMIDDLRPRSMAGG